MSTTGLHDVVAAAEALAPQIRAARDEIEASRCLPDSLVQAMIQAGLFQLNLPSAMGGPEAPPLTTFEAIEALSKIEGSVGWCAMISSSVSLFLSRLRADVGQALAGQPADVRAAGSVRPEGEAYPAAGGYRLRGRWDFASGVMHANWLLCTCKIMANHQTRQTAATAPEMRSFLVPKEAVTVKDTWSVVGMCGTGSHDFVVDDVFIPDEHSFSLVDPSQVAGTLYHPRLLMIMAWNATAANALGMARGAIDTFCHMASQTRSTMSETLLRDRSLVQTRVAEAEAIVGAARAYVISAVHTAWEAVQHDVADPSREVAQARLAITHAMHESVRAVDLVFHAAGTNAVYRKHPLERYFRDVHVAVQHAAGLPGHIESAGKIFLGLRLNEVGW